VILFKPLAKIYYIRANRYPSSPPVLSGSQRWRRSPRQGRRRRVGHAVSATRRLISPTERLILNRSSLLRRLPSVFCGEFTNKRKSRQTNPTDLASRQSRWLIGLIRRGLQGQLAGPLSRPWRGTTGIWIKTNSRTPRCRLTNG
jgi:hypothetical protein